MTRPKAEESISMQMELSTKESGSMTSNTDVALKSGLTDPPMKAFMLKD